MATYLSIGVVFVLFYLWRTKQFDQDWEEDSIPELLLVVGFWPVVLAVIIWDEW